MLQKEYPSPTGEDHSEKKSINMLTLVLYITIYPVDRQSLESHVETIFN